MVMEKQWDLHRPLHANLTFVPAKQSGLLMMARLPKLEQAANIMAY